MIVILLLGALAISSPPPLLLWLLLLLFLLLLPLRLVEKRVKRAERGAAADDAFSVSSGQAKADKTVASGLRKAGRQGRRKRMTRTRLKRRRKVFKSNHKYDGTVGINQNDVVNNWEAKNSSSAKPPDSLSGNSLSLTLCPVS
jgi:hypothetical protein